MLDQIVSDNSDVFFERISLLEDMKTEYDQKSIFEKLSMDVTPLGATSVVSNLVRG